MFRSLLSRLRPHLRLADRRAATAVASPASIAARPPGTPFAPLPPDTDLAALAPGTPVPFLCNLCGRPNTVVVQALARETPSCAGCGSTVRFRAMAHLVVRELGLPDAPLAALPPRRDLVGLGLSDAAAYAVPLATRFDYTNTWYHAEPRLDIAAIPDSRIGTLDFLVASDVFEHVVPPVGLAFRNAHALLKPGGVLVFTVPFSLDAATVEHFPELHEWRVVVEDGKHVLLNRTRDGRAQRFTGLVFHGGPGSTLEMRLFSRDALLRELGDAGFREVRIAAEPCVAHGIVWPEPWSVPIVARA
jgi:SAM-dependent methyltransferase